jgi:hypothetical protein
VKLIDAIVNGEITEEQKQEIINRFDDRREVLMVELKKMIGASIDEKVGGRFRLVRARIRRGKVQRRRKVSNMAGYTFRNKKLIKMKVRERVKRKRGARRAAIKRRGKISSFRRKYKLALRKRKSLGV